MKAWLKKMRCSPRCRHPIGICCLFLSLQFFSGSILADTSLENSVKAAFIYNFTKLISWPDSSFDGDDAAIELCVFGAPELQTFLAQAASNKTSQNRPLSSTLITQPAQLSGCHLLYLGNASIPEAFRPDKLPASILTIGENVDFIRAGGMIGFTAEDGKLRFVINHRKALKQDLRISSKLLSLALHVER